MTKKSRVETESGGLGERPAHGYPKGRSRIFGICCPDTFRTPIDRSGNILCTGSNNEHCPANRRKAGEFFRMKATFSQGDGCVCKRCVYRQFVRGKFEVNGRRIRHRLVNTRNGRGVYMRQGSYREDAIRLDDPGVPLPLPNVDDPPIAAYGYRGHAARPGNRYEPNQKIGCEYHGIDFPGILDLDPEDRFLIDLKFEGRIVETETGRIMDRKRWRVFYRGVWPAPQGN